MTAAFEILSIDLEKKRIGVALVEDGSARPPASARDLAVGGFGSLADKLRGAPAAGEMIRSCMWRARSFLIVALIATLVSAAALAPNQARPANQRVPHPRRPLDRWNRSGTHSELHHHDRERQDSERRERSMKDR
jgi:hypothetical protein